MSGSGERRYDPVVRGGRSRIVTVYEIEGGSCGCSGPSIVDTMNFDRLHGDLERARSQLPQRCQLDSLTVLSDGAEWEADIEVYALDRNRHVAVVRCFQAGSHHQVADAMEVLYRREFVPSGYVSWDRYLGDRGFTLGNFTFQLVQLGDGIMSLLDGVGPSGVRSVIGSLVYRYPGKYEELSSRLVWPEESNRGGSLSVVSPFAALSGRHQGYVENAFFLSALLYVGARVALISLRRRLYQNLTMVDRLQATTADPRLRRAALGSVSSSVGAMEIELSASVESYLKVESLLLSLRASDFHESLFGSARVAEEATALATMLERLRSGLQGELGELSAIYGARDERRRLLASAFVGALTVLGVPLGILFGYFGMNAAEVSAQASFLDIPENPVIYGLLLSVLVIGLLILLGLPFVLRWLDSSRAAKVEALIEGEGEGV